MYKKLYARLASMRFCCVNRNRDRSSFCFHRDAQFKQIRKTQLRTFHGPLTRTTLPPHTATTLVLLAHITSKCQAYVWNHIKSGQILFVHLGMYIVLFSHPPCTHSIPSYIIFYVYVMLWSIALRKRFILFTLHSFVPLFKWIATSANLSMGRGRSYVRSHFSGQIF